MMVRKPHNYKQDRESVGIAIPAMPTAHNARIAANPRAEMILRHDVSRVECDDDHVRAHTGQSSFIDHKRQLPAFQARSNRSAFITLFQAATKSCTNFCCASQEP